MARFAGITPGLLLSTGFASVGALMFGLDNGWWGIALGLTSFNAGFGSLSSTSGGVTVRRLSSFQQSVGTSLGQAGIMIGCALSTPINRYYGRRAGIKIMAVIGLVGVLMQATCAINGHRYWQLVCGKLVNSISMGIAANVVPMYMSELSPAKWRGAIINLYQSVSIAGVIVAAIVVFQLSEAEGDRAWLTPVCLQFFAPAFLLAGVFWMPESPRWLIWQDRDLDARLSLLRLHGSEPNYSPDAEVTTLHAAFEAEKLAKVPSLLAVFQGSDLRRTNIAAGVQCLQQAQGASYMTNYVILFLFSLGFIDVFKIIMAVYCTYFAAILFSFYLPDHFGRRPLLMLGAAVCGACLIVVSTLNIAVVPLPSAARRVSLGLIFIWYFFFGLVWSPLTWITSAEVASTRAREPTITVATFSGFTVGLIITLISPYIQNAEYGNIGGSIGFIWGAITVLSIPWVYFLVPEMRGLSLEQIDYLFAQNTPVRKFAASSCPIAAESPSASNSPGANSIGLVDAEVSDAGKV